MDIQNFQEWRLKQRISFLFFYGSSKGNPGVAGAGGILYDFKGRAEITYAWGLAQATNNQAKVYAILQCLVLAKKQQLCYSRHASIYNTPSMLRSNLALIDSNRCYTMIYINCSIEDTILYR
jgi:hypothetical protein